MPDICAAQSKNMENIHLKYDILEEKNWEKIYIYIYSQIYFNHKVNIIIYSNISNVRIGIQNIYLRPKILKTTQSAGMQWQSENLCPNKRKNNVWSMQRFVNNAQIWSSNSAE